MNRFHVHHGKLPITHDVAPNAYPAFPAYSVPFRLR
nr:MAG TPA: hypothetical protein [Caudoviricetes sp.]